MTGDHGESFGDRHANNFVHKERIYDENIREFLLLWDGQFAARKLIPNTIVSRRMGANADIMPTLLALLDLPPADVPGRNLLTENFPRPHGLLPQTRHAGRLGAARRALEVHRGHSYRSR